MRITIITGPFHPTPPGPSGAVERRWYYVAREFARKGHEVTFLSKHAPGLSASEIDDGVRHYRYTNFAASQWLIPNLFFDFLYAVRLLWALPRGDILVTNDFMLPLLAQWLRRDAGRISINVARVPKGQLFIYRGVERLVGVSSMIRDEIIHQTPSLSSRARFVPNPIDTSVFCLEGEQDILAGSELEIVFTGRIHPEKGLETLIAAHRQLATEFPELRLRVVGPWRVEAGGGGESYLARLKQLVGQAKVEFTEPIYDRAALARVIKRGRFYCYPSVAERGEAFPCAPLEAMGCGRVPVVSKLPQFRDYIRDGENGVYFDHTAADPVAALVVKLRALIIDDELTRRLATQAAQDATYYSFSHIADLYLRDFQEMLGESLTTQGQSGAAVCSIESVSRSR